jgi:hypothetical protein
MRTKADPQGALDSGGIRCTWPSGKRTACGTRWIVDSEMGFSSIRSGLGLSNLGQDTPHALPSRRRRWAALTMNNGDTTLLVPNAA